MISEPLDATTPIVWSRLRVDGEGAVSYLQGQLTQDVERAAGAWSLVLEPDGTVISSLWVTRREDGVDLVVPGALADTVLARLNRFRLRARCSITLEGDCAGPLATLGEQIGALVPGEAEFAAGTWQVKDLSAGQQQSVPEAELVAVLRGVLSA